MALFGLVFLVVALILIGVGIVVGLVACCVAAVLVGVGVVSSSVVVGLFSRSPVAGVRAFLLQCGVLAGIPAGILCAWLAHSIFEAYGNNWLVFLYGALGGALGGVALSSLSLWILFFDVYTLGQQRGSRSLHAADLPSTTSSQLAPMNRVDMTALTSDL
jgi:hypothetical protein